MPLPCGGAGAQVFVFNFDKMWYKNLPPSTQPRVKVEAIAHLRDGGGGRGVVVANFWLIA